VADRSGPLEWCVAARPIEGEDRSGDDALVLSTEHDALVAVVDGVGHGPAASHAAEAAIRALRDGPWLDVTALAERCHEALRATRGAAIGLAVFHHAGTVTWLGVGNITGRLVSGGAPAGAGGHWLASLSGIAGDDLPRLRAETIPVRRGDVFILATDGIDGAFAEHVAARGSCEEIAHRTLQDFGRATDDALVLVARYLAEDA
jgi:negative regulator of sigma-B (phosphoserine phosphatase)